MGEAHEALISDGAHSGGTPGFLFLPPMVADPDLTGPFEARLAPRVVIDEVEPATGVVGRRVVELTMAGQGGEPADLSESVRVDAAGEHYLVNFHTDRYDLDPARYYRVRVLVGPRELGFADLDVVASGRELRHVDDDHYIPLLDGRTLPIKFRIERFVVDGDQDDVFDQVDVCPTVPDPAQEDTDGDGRGDACECVDVVCAAADDCHLPGTCDPATGSCDAPRAPDGVVCVAAPSPAADASCQQGRCERRVDSIDLTPETLVVAAGESAPLVATALDSTGVPIASAAVTYQLSDPAVGTYDAVTGSFTATSAGVTTLVASAGGASSTAMIVAHGSSGSTTLVLTGGGLPAGTWIGPGDTGASGTAVSVLTPGQSVELVATFNVLSVPAASTQGFFQWGSSDPGVATVSPAGTVTAVGTGFALITGSFGGLTGSFALVSAPARSRATSCRGGGWGDPHLVTHDGLGYDLQAAGELLLAANHDAGVEVHARLEPVPAAGADDLSLISAVAMGVNGHALSLADEHAAFLRIDGEPLDVPAGGVFLAGGGRVDRFGPTEVQVSLPTGPALTVATSGAVGRPLSVRVCRGAAQVGTWRGLLGNGNGVAGDDLTGADGTSYGAPMTAAGWRAFTDGWRLPGDSHLLHYPPGTSGATYQQPGFPASRRGVASLPAATRTWADGVCRAAGVADAWLLACCTLDVGATGDATYAHVAAAIEPPVEAIPVEDAACDAAADPACAPSVPSCPAGRAAGHTTSGYYRIDPDGAGTGLEPWVVWCDMEREGGGWTLLAHHRSGQPVVARDLVQPEVLGVTDDARWRLLRDTYTDGMMFVDEHGRVSRVSRVHLTTGNCRSLQTVASLVPGRPGSAPDGRLWHDENSGCTIIGQDYSLLYLGPADIYGASVYQMSAKKFSLWPYADLRASYFEASRLRYFIR